MGLIGGSEGRASSKLFELSQLGRRNRFRNEAAIRGLCANAYLGEGSLICRVLGRYKLFVDAADIGLSSHLLLDGYWEMWLTEMLADVVKPGMVVVDIGANLGYFTMLMSDLVGPLGRVHAFEPNPYIAERLERSIAVNGLHARTVVHTEPLSEFETDVVLVVPAGEPKNGYIAAPDFNPANGERVIGMRTRRFDSFADMADADVIKIDADGSEELIWRGMSGHLSRGRPLIVFLEFAASRYPDAEAFIARIKADGFSIGRLTLTDGEQAVTTDEILAEPRDCDIMLVLRR